MKICTVAIIVIAVICVIQQIRKHKGKTAVIQIKWIAVLFVASLAGLMVGIQEEKKQGELYIIEKNRPGEGEREEILRMHLPELETEYVCKINIPEVKRNQQECEDLLRSAVLEMEAAFWGENRDTDKITQNLNMQSTYQDGQVDAVWECNPGEVLNTKGIIQWDMLKGEEQQETVTVTLSCGEQETVRNYQVRICSSARSREERILKEVQNQIDSQQETEGHILLPKKMEGYETSWTREKEYIPEKILFLGIVTAITLCYTEQERKERQKRKRWDALRAEYPDLVSQLSLLLGAGMPVLSAIRRMVDRYENQKKWMYKKERYAYEELKKMIYEIDNGKSELRAYAGFGEACCLQNYRKLSQLLVQSQQMGNRKLMQILYEESEHAFEERMNRAKKLGEEASTKLLFPMLLMLGIVMLLILVAAYLSFPLGDR